MSGKIGNSAVNSSAPAPFMIHKKQSQVRQVSKARSAIKMMGKGLRLKSFFSRRFKIPISNDKEAEEMAAKTARNLLAVHGGNPKQASTKGILEGDALRQLLQSHSNNDKYLNDHMDKLIQKMDDVSALNLYKRLKKSPIGASIVALKKEEKQTPLGEEVRKVDQWLRNVSQQLENKLLPKDNKDRPQSLNQHWENTEPKAIDKVFYKNILNDYLGDKNTSIKNVRKYIEKHCKSETFNIEQFAKDFPKDDYQKCVDELQNTLSEPLQSDMYGENITMLLANLKKISYCEEIPMDFRKTVSALRKTIKEEQKNIGEATVKSLAEVIAESEKKIEDVRSFIDNCQNQIHKVSKQKEEIQKDWDKKEPNVLSSHEVAEKIKETIKIHEELIAFTQKKLKNVKSHGILSKRNSEKEALNVLIKKQEEATNVLRQELEQQTKNHEKITRYVNDLAHEIRNCGAIIEDIQDKIIPQEEEKLRQHQAELEQQKEALQGQKALNQNFLQSVFISSVNHRP